MADTPWTGDACSLVDAFRSGERSPGEELEATFKAIENSDLNCFSHLDPERAQAVAKVADVNKPFGGVPAGIKELEPVEGWPYTEGSLVFKDRVATHSSTLVERVLDNGGAVPVGLTTSSEFGGLNVSVTKLNGVAHNPWEHGRSAGGSSGGSASAVGGGLVSLATGGDGGGSIRIPAGYCGLFGMKGTYGRVPRGPYAYIRPSTVVLGNLARSVRDAARFYDVTAGYDHHDPTSIPSPGNWEADLGSTDLTGKKVMVDPGLGGMKLEPGVAELIEENAEILIKATGMVRVEHELNLPTLAAQWAMGNLSTLLADLGKRWPGCADDLTHELAAGFRLSQGFYNLNTAADAEKLRVQANEAIANAFDKVDFIIGATNPGPAFPAEATTSSAEASFIDWAANNVAAKYAYRGAMFSVRFAGAFFPRMPAAVLAAVSGKFPELVNMGKLTIISNITGNPACSLPAGSINGLPVGMQVLAPHHEDKVLFDAALAFERERPWPLVAPASLTQLASAAR